MDKNRRDTAKDDRPCKELNEAENEYKHFFLPGANTSVSSLFVALVAERFSYLRMTQICLMQPLCFAH